MQKYGHKTWYRKSGAKIRGHEKICGKISGLQSDFHLVWPAKWIVWGPVGTAKIFFAIYVQLEPKKARPNRSPENTQNGAFRHHCPGTRHSCGKTGRQKGSSDFAEFFWMIPRYLFLPLSIRLFWPPMHTYTFSLALVSNMPPSTYGSKAWHESGIHQSGR